MGGLSGFFEDTWDSAVDITETIITGGLNKVGEAPRKCAA